MTQATAHSRRSRRNRNAIPPELIRSVFCGTAERFTRDGDHEFRRGDQPLDTVIEAHVSGDASLGVDPLTPDMETAWQVVTFFLADNLQHPFSKAREFSDFLASRGIPSMLEVTEGGKGYYRVWIFYDTPVPSGRAGTALNALCREMFGIGLPVHPVPEDHPTVPLPFQGESILLQRRVFVNSVGKMLGDPRHLLATVPRAERAAVNRLLADYGSTAKKAPSTSAKKEAAVAPIVIPFAELSRAQHVEPPQTSPLHQEPITLSFDMGMQVAASYRKVSDDPAIGEGDTAELLVVHINGAVYGIDTRDVVEVLPADRVTGPGDPGREYAGVVATADELVPVIDPGRLLGGKPLEPGRIARVVVIDGAVRYGIGVEGTGGIQTLAESGIKAVTGESTESAGGYVLGKAELSKRRHLFRLDAGKFATELSWLRAFGRVVKANRPREGLMVFLKLGDVSFCVDAADIDTIIPGFELENTAGKKPGLAGSVPKDGQMIPVLDPAVLTGLGRRHDAGGDAPLTNERILIVEAGNILFGVLVDDVSDVRREEYAEVPFPRDMMADSWCCDALLRFPRNGYRFRFDPSLLLERADFGAVMA